MGGRILIAIGVHYGLFQFYKMFEVNEDNVGDTLAYLSEQIFPERIDAVG